MFELHRPLICKVFVFFNKYSGAPVSVVSHLWIQVTTDPNSIFYPRLGVHGCEELTEVTYRFLIVWVSVSQPPHCARVNCNTIYFLFFKDFIYLVFRQRGREGERKGKKRQCVVASCAPPNGDLAHNPGMCSDWKSNQQPFALQASAQSTKPHQPGLFPFRKIIFL